MDGGGREKTDGGQNRSRACGRGVVWGVTLLLTVNNERASARAAQKKRTRPRGTRLESQLGFWKHGFKYLLKINNCRQLFILTQFLEQQQFSPVPRQLLPLSLVRFMKAGVTPGRRTVFINHVGLFILPCFPLHPINLITR